VSECARGGVRVQMDARACACVRACVRSRSRVLACVLPCLRASAIEVYVKGGLGGGVRTSGRGSAHFRGE